MSSVMNRTEMKATNRKKNETELAINGGKPAVDPEKAAALMPMATAWPRVDDADLDAIKRVLTMAPYTFYDEGIRLEEEFAVWTGSRYAVAHTNGTAALHAALFAVGVKPGDEVIVPSYTFLATCTPALACKAIPVFAEIAPDSLNLDPADVERRVTPRTRASIEGPEGEAIRSSQLGRSHGKVWEFSSVMHRSILRSLQSLAIRTTGCGKTRHSCHITTPCEFNTFAIDGEFSAFLA